MGDQIKKGLAAIQVSGSDSFAADHQNVAVIRSPGSASEPSSAPSSDPSSPNADTSGCASCHELTPPPLIPVGPAVSPEVPSSPGSESGSVPSSGPVEVSTCSDSQDSNKVLICHVPPGNPAAAHTLCISRNALFGHGLDLSHSRSSAMHSDDYLGACGSSVPSPAAGE